MILTILLAAPLVEPPEAVDLDPAADVVRVALTAEEIGDGRYAYNGSSPGPTIRVEVGQTLVVELLNNLTSATTIHWHGVAVPFDMDGVAWMRDPVEPGGTFTYMFSPPRPGTYWYHPHFNTARQVDGGLKGMLIVEEPSEPQPEDVVLIFDADAEHQPEARHAHGHARIVTEWVVNGIRDAELRIPGGTVVRARMLNASNVGYLALRTSGMTQIGSDQGLLAAAIEPESVLLAPGDRADFEWRIGETDFVLETDAYSLNGGPAHGDPIQLLSVGVDLPAPAPPGLPWPFTGGAVSPDPSYTDILYVFQGSDRTRRWRINGETFPQVTIEELALGQEAVVEVRNVSPTEHPFHIHGLNFEVLSINGVPPPAQMIEDTINLRIRQRLRMRILADNPGDWMTHCHILPHAEEGMMTVLRVR